MLKIEEFNNLKPMAISKFSWNETPKELRHCNDNSIDLVFHIFEKFFYQECNEENNEPVVEETKPR